MRNSVSENFGPVTIVMVALVLGACQSESEEPAANFQGVQPANSTPSNAPPSISGSPASTVKVSESYLFVPIASDPDNDEISFSIRNVPVWASFDALTGVLSGTPKQQHVGTYADIAISVSDGVAGVPLASFSIDVVDSGPVSIILSWTPPTRNTDGSALINLAGYNIYYGLSKGDYPNKISIDNPGIATFVVENLTPNTYYFVATSVNSNGIESDYSNVVAKVAG